MENQETSLMLKALSDRRCLEILKIIAIEPSYVKELATLLKTKESRISEKTKMMKEAGIISEEWKRSGNKLVKFFKPSVTQISISLKDGYLRTEALGNEIKENVNYEHLQVIVPEVGNFVGRKRELEFMEKHGQVFITGIPGIGKTTLAAKFVSMQHTPVFWHEFKEVDTLKHVLMKIAIHLVNLGNSSLLDQLRRDRDRRAHVNIAISGLRASSSIVVFDDLQRSKDSETIEMIKDLIHSFPKLKLILIGREDSQFFDSGLEVLTLQEMKVDDAIELIGNDAGSRRTVQQFGGHPLVLKLVKNSSIEIQTESKFTSLKMYIAGELLPSMPTNLRSIIEKFSLFRGRTDLKEVEFIFGSLNKNELKRGEELGLYRIKNDTVYVNDLIKEAVYDTIENKLNFHLKLAAYYKSKEDPESLIEGLYHLGKSGSNEEIIRFLDEFGMGLLNSAYLSNLQNELLQIEKELSACEAKAEVLYWIGKILSTKMNFIESLNYFKKSKLCPQSPGLKLKVLYDEAVILQNIGELEKSEVAFRKALSLIKQDNGIQEGRILYGLGYLLIYLGKMKESRLLLMKAQNIFRERNDSMRYNTTLFAMSFLSYVRGNLREAISLNDRALEGFLNLSATYSYATTLLTKGEILFSSGEREKGLSAFDEAIDILENLGDSKTVVSYALIKRSLFKISMNKIKIVQSDLKRARKMTSQASDEFLAGFLDLAEGALLSRQNKIQSAEKKIRKSLTKERFDPINMHTARRELGLVLIKKGNVVEGLKIIEELLKYLKKKGYVTFYKETRKIYNQQRMDTKTLRLR